MVDGVPLNDPFGGWVAWYKVPRLSLAGAEIARGGGSGAWGNAALGGTLSLFSEDFNQPGGLGVVTGGEFGTWLGEAATTQRITSRSAFRLDAAAFRTEGFYTVLPSQRGAIDRRLDSDYQRLQISWEQRLSENTTAVITGRTFSEERGNGTPLQQNGTRENFLSTTLSGRTELLPAWSWVSYVQRQHFNSFFSSVDATRATETPANDQFDVPSSAAGTAFTAQWLHANRATTTAGADARWVKGETREAFSYLNGRFTRQRRAGGEQSFAGLFATHDRPLFKGWFSSLALRLDHWENAQGHRRETDLITSSSVRDERYVRDRGVELSPRLGITGPLGFSGLRGRAAVYQAFRIPTLNEYYRPFRVGNVNTEANPALKRETVDGLEVGFDYRISTATVSITGFVNDLNDAVANVTLSRTPTLVSRQRRNLDSVRVRGIESTVTWAARPTLTLRADYLYHESEVRRASEQPGLVGLKLAQVPRHTLTAGATWTLPPRWTFDARVRTVASQFEDDENTLSLSAYTAIDLQLAYRFNRTLEFFLSAENTTDEKIETGRTTDGLVSIDGPRRIRGGIKLAW
ncbi:MAG TPA: TonB-dependent receptor, partial [Opitutaceae bacterium]|nr:TonB-dependent receptor [Opitutaceae bacterium]